MKTKKMSRLVRKDLADTFATLEINEMGFSKEKINRTSRTGRLEVMVHTVGVFTVWRHADAGLYDVCEALRRIADALDP